jgi:hypothetical protein
MYDGRCELAVLMGILRHLQVNTRYWGFRNATEGADPAKPEVTLCPLLDMADHAEVTRSGASCFTTVGT